MSRHAPLEYRMALTSLRYRLRRREGFQVPEGPDAAACKGRVSSLTDACRPACLMAIYVKRRQTRSVNSRDGQKSNTRIQARQVTRIRGCIPVRDSVAKRRKLMAQSNWIWTHSPIY